MFVKKNQECTLGFQPGPISPGTIPRPHAAPWIMSHENQERKIDQMAAQTQIGSHPQDAERPPICSPCVLNPQLCPPC